MIATGTASGKTLCYNLPVLDELLRQPDSRALYLFPTKALAQDQADELRTLDAGRWTLDSGQSRRIQPPTSNLQHLVATYDGDTPTDQRPAIRHHARIVITNPDMLHTGILPHHTKWQAFFERLRFVVIDELHALRGVFGSHVANVLRRLRINHGDPEATADVVVSGEYEVGMQDQAPPALGPAAGLRPAAPPLSMGWCIDCHRKENAARGIRGMFSRTRSKTMIVSYKE